jgi:hypothetical protein
MAIEIIKTIANSPSSRKALELDKEFSSFEEAEEFVETEILPKEIYKYVTFKMRNPLNSSVVSKVREYIFLDAEDYFIYSYRITETTK